MFVFLLKSNRFMSVEYYFFRDRNKPIIHTFMITEWYNIVTLEKSGSVGYLLWMFLFVQSVKLFLLKGWRKRVPVHAVRSKS